MNKIVCHCIFICSLFLIIAISICAPHILNGTETFANEFVGADLLNFLGVVVTITLTSTGHLHLEFNKIEEQAGRILLVKSRAAVQRSAFSLIASLLTVLVVLAIKPFVAGGWLSFVNGFGLLIVLFDILVMLDITKATFRLGPMLPLEGQG